MGDAKYEEHAKMFRVLTDPINDAALEQGTHSLLFIEEDPTDTKNKHCSLKDTIE